jgi:hypothetical protein
VHSVDEAMVYVITQSYLNNCITRDELTDEGNAALNYGLAFNQENRADMFTIMIKKNRYE